MGSTHIDSFEFFCTGNFIFPLIYWLIQGFLEGVSKDLWVCLFGVVSTTMLAILLQLCHWEFFHSPPLENFQSCFSVCFVLSLLSDPSGCPRFMLYIPCRSSRISHFSENLGFLSLENGFRYRDLSAGCAHFTEMSLLPGLLRGQS